MAKKKFQKNKKRKKRKVNSGVAYVNCTFNNTIITITDENGDTLVQKSPPHVGFVGSKKSTAYAATKAALAAGEIAIKKYGLREAKVVLEGLGAGRNASVKGLDSAGIRITMLVDRTRIPHNGCRPPKMPRK